MERKQAVYYQTGEFANRAGVTVRTLHHYDELGLLRPSVRSDAGYRLYTDADFVRLQQIATLQLIGFPLKEIRQILDGKALTLAAALRVQRELIAQKRDQLDAAIAAIERAEHALDAGPAEQLDALRAVMESITMQENWDWVKEKYTPEQLEALAKRDDPDKRAQWAEQWSTLIAQVKAAQHEDPAGPNAQALAGRWHGLITAFTGGDPAIESNLRNVYQDDRARKPFDAQTGAFIERALEIYRRTL